MSAPDSLSFALTEDEARVAASRAALRMSLSAFTLLSR